MAEPRAPSSETGSTRDALSGPRTAPYGCSDCGYDPVSGNFYDTPTTESCSVSLQAKLLATGALRVHTEDFACY